MTEISKKEYARYFFIIFFLALLVLTFFMIKPFITPILLSIILAYSCYPIYEKLNKGIKNKSVCSILLVLVILIVLAIPSFFIIKSLVSEAIPVYNFVSKISNSFSPELKELFQKGMSGFFSSLTPSINSLTNTLISFLVFIFFLFYFFRDGEEILDSIIDKIPLQKMQKEKFLEEFKNVTNAGVYGLILVGLLEGILGAVGFYLFKVPSPIFWGLLIMILSMLPVVGTSLAWIPVALTKFAAHDYFNGIAILLFGIIILSGIETFAHPRIIGKKANIHPLAIVLGVFGGIGFLGITGIIFGPLIFVMLGAIVNLILQGEK